MSQSARPIRIVSTLNQWDWLQVRTGEWVVIKPNLVKQFKENDHHEWECVITDKQLIEDVCFEVCKRLGSNGKITICDAPQTDSSFSQIAIKLGLYELAERATKRFGTHVEIVDLRNEEWTSEAGIITERKKLKGDPNGSVAFNLGKHSLFYEHPGEGRYYGADYDAGVVNSHHYGETQEYLICATPILADVFINMPKLKTHKKTGVTLNLKNLVGINADKNWLPHHTCGSPADGGDEFPSMSWRKKIEQVSVRFARKLALNSPGIGPLVAQKLRKAGTVAFGDGSKTIRSGNWYRNDTTWRMVLDLNRCLLYGNPDGSFRDTQPKRYYSVIDGLVGMQGSGPMQGDRMDSGVVICGDDPVTVDMVACRLMGFDWRKIPTIREAYHLPNFPITSFKPEDVWVESDRESWNGRFLDIENNDFLHFEPHFGWKGHIEYSR
jgi:uncharacterized protein (DUF362 family)